MRETHQGRARHASPSSAAPSSTSAAWSGRCATCSTPSKSRTSRFFTTRDRVRLREAAARCARLGDELQSLSERAVLVHEQILDTRAEQMNKTMLVLTAVTVIFMPLTVISGILGMNVAGIPFADEPWAFWGVARRPRRPRRRPRRLHAHARSGSEPADRRLSCCFCNSTFESRNRRQLVNHLATLRATISPQTRPSNAAWGGHLQGEGNIRSGTVGSVASAPATMALRDRGVSAESWEEHGFMDSNYVDKSRLPSRHVTEGPERAPHRSYLYAMGLTDRADPPAAGRRRDRLERSRPLQHLAPAPGAGGEEGRRRPPRHAARVHHHHRDRRHRHGPCRA